MCVLVCVYGCVYVCVCVGVYVCVCVCVCRRILLISFISNRTILLSGIQFLAEVCVLPESLRCVIILLLLATAYKYRVF